MPALSRALPAAIALSLTATLVGGAAAAADLRADERRAQAERERIAAAEALARAEGEYRTAVGALAEDVFDQVQPLQEAIDRVVEVDDGSFTVLSDVSARGGGADALKSLRTRLGQIGPPPTMAEAHRTLDAGMEALVRGAGSVVDAVAPDLGEEPFFRTLVNGDDALDSGVRILNTELKELFPDGAPPLAAETGAPERGRPARSKAAYLYGVGTLCATSVPQNDDDAAGLRQDAQHLRSLLRGLAAVPAPAADAELVRTSIAEHVERGNAVVEGFEGAAAALDRRDQRALVAAQVKIERGILALDRAADGFAAYGSQTCEISFSSDGEDSEEPERPA